MTRRRFTPAQKAAIIQRQHGKCACCGEPLGSDPRDIEFDHELPLHLGGHDALDNLRAVIKKHHVRKSVRELKARAKIKRIKAKDGLHKKKLSAADKALARMLEG